MNTAKHIFKGCSDGRTPSDYSKTCLQGMLWWEDTFWLQQNMSSRDALMGGHLLITAKHVFKGWSDGRTPSDYSKTCVQGMIWWEDTFWLQQNMSSRDDLMGGHLLITAKHVFKGCSDGRTRTFWLGDVFLEQCFIFSLYRNLRWRGSFSDCRLTPCMHSLDENLWIYIIPKLYRIRNLI